MSRSMPLAIFPTRSSRNSRMLINQEAFEPDTLPDSEDLAWKRKYRQSLNDVDLAKQFAGFMPEDISKSFLEHNQAEFEGVLESRPTRPTTIYSTSAESRSSIDSTWRDLDISQSRRPSRKSSMFGSSPVYSTIEEDAPWGELDLSATRSDSMQQPAPMSVVEGLTHVESTASKSSRRQKLLKPVTSFVNLVRRPSR